MVLTQDVLCEARAICMRCGDRCCIDAHPPISQECHKRLVAAEMSQDVYESDSYLRFKTNDGGECFLMQEGKCSVHAIKPEICRAGPFTFDVTGDRITMYLKHEAICPIVGLFKAEPQTCRMQYERAVQNSIQLVAQLPSKELEVICRTERPGTVKVAEFFFHVP